MVCLANYPSSDVNYYALLTVFLNETDGRRFFQDVKFDGNTGRIIVNFLLILICVFVHRLTLTN